MPCTGGFAGILPLRLGGDDETGVTAAQHARLAADLVAVKRVSPFCVFAWTGQLGLDGLAPVTYYFGMNGEGLAFAPVNSTPGADSIAFRFSAGSFSDSYQISAPFRPRKAAVTFSGTTLCTGTHDLLADGVQIYGWDAAGDPVNPVPAGYCVLW